MASSPDIPASFQSIPQKKDILRKAFGDLETQKNLIARCLQGWEVLDQHLAEIHTALETRYVEILERERKLKENMQSLEEKEISLEAKMKEREAALDKRENLIESREQASLARVQEQKESAVAAIREQKRKWMEERQLLQSQCSARSEESTPKLKPKDDQIAKTVAMCSKGRSKENPSKGCFPDGKCSTIKSKSNSPSNIENVQGCVGSSSRPNDESKPMSKAITQLGPTAASNYQENLKNVQDCIDSSSKPKDESKPTPKAIAQLGPETASTNQENVKNVQDYIHLLSKINDETKPIPHVNPQHGLIKISNTQGRVVVSRTMNVEGRADMSIDFDLRKVKLEPDVDAENAETTYVVEQIKQTNGVVDCRLEKGKYSNDHEGMDDGDKMAAEQGDECHRHDDASGYLNKGLNSVPSVVPRPQLKLFCEKMDAPGLCTFITTQKKDMNFIRRELPFALKYALDPPRLVLMAVEGYYSADQGLEICPTKLSIRKTCISLMEALGCVLVDGSMTVPSSLQEEAKLVADQWKEKINFKGNDQASLMDAQCFLQLLATFNLGNQYSQDELCDIVAPICNRRTVPKLWRDLGMSTQSPDVVHRLIKSGKQLEAVAFIHEFQLCERFPPVPILKSYLKDIRKLQSNKNSSDDQNQLLMKELGAIKEVLKCIQKYKLEASYPTDGLHKRVLQLEKRNPDKKRVSDIPSCGGKKMRTSNGPGGCTPLGAPHNGQFRVSEKPHSHGRGMGARNPYVSPFGGIGRTDVYLTYSGGRSSYGTPPFTHSSYQYGGGPPSSYHGSYMHR